MSKFIHQRMPSRPLRATTLTLLAGAMAAALLLAVNLYLLWSGYVPLRTTWQTFADPALSERMLAPAEWLVSHLLYLRSAVPLPTDGNLPVPEVMAQPKTWLA